MRRATVVDQMTDETFPDGPNTALLCLSGQPTFRKGRGGLDGFVDSWEADSSFSRRSI